MHFSRLFNRSLKFGIFSDNTTRSYEINTEQIDVRLGNGTGCRPARILSGA